MVEGRSPINLLWLSELLNLTAFLETADSEVRIVHICRVIVVYTLTHCGQVTHICVSKLTIISSHNGLSPDWRQAIIWTNAGVLLIGSLGTNFSEILIEIHTFSFKKINLKMSSVKWQPFCLGINVLKQKSNSTSNCSLLDDDMP